MITEIKKNDKELTQKERLGVELNSLKKDITTGDRQAALDNLNCTESKLSNYLNGRVADNDEAVKMILFFRKRIEDRDQLIGK